MPVGNDPRRRVAAAAPGIPKVSTAAAVTAPTTPSRTTAPMPTATTSTTSRPARGQRLPRPARRAQLLAAAQAAFVESGYYAAAMDDIAARAGVSKPVLYQHFPGKLELYLALLDERASDLVVAVRAALDTSTDNKERVFATISAYFEFVARDGSAYRLLFDSDLINEEAVSSRIDEALTRCGEAFADLITADTKMSRADAMVLAMALTGMAQVAARNWAVLDTTVGRQETARLVGQLAWRGLGGFPKVARPAEAPAAGEHAAPS
ncbi:MAG: TetR/AcrR family transcriptional regulator [Candidatus Phosphoribacter sp.]